MEINKANELVDVVFLSHVREDVVNMLDNQLVIDIPFAIHVVYYQPTSLLQKPFLSKLINISKECQLKVATR